MSKRRGWPAALLGAALLAPLALGGGAQPPPDPLPPPPADAPKAKAAAPSAADVLKAADEFARKLAGTNDDARYHDFLEIALNAATRREAVRRVPASLPDRVAARALLLEPGTTLQESPVGLKNRTKLVQEALKASPGQVAQIILGIPAQQGDFPHCVALGRDGYFSCCTGTLIGPNVVVTAAHCAGLVCSPTEVYFGTDAQPGRIDRSRVRPIKKGGVLPHPSYNPTTKENDIALLILDKPVDIPDVKPCPLAATSDIAGAFSLLVAGFGITEKASEGEGVLYSTQVWIRSYSCAEPQSRQDYACNAGKEMVALGFASNTCRGDSGGPAYIVKERELRLAGVTSGGDGPCKKYGVYTRVDVYKDWIDATAKANGEMGERKTTQPEPGGGRAAPK